MKTDKGARILVVDDDADLSQMLLAYLKRCGWEGERAGSGAEAMASFTGGGFQAVLLDLGLPDIDGMELLERMQARDSQVVVVVITGSGTLENAVAAIKAGAYDFIAKPPDLKRLELTVDRALEHSRLMRQRGMFRGLTLALLVSVPLWLVLGILLARFLG